MRLRLSFSVNLGSTETGGDITMGDWADNALKRLSDQQTNKQTQTDAFLEKRRVRRDFGMPLWLEVREKVKTNCADLNTKAKHQILTFEVTVNTELSVRGTIDGIQHFLTAEFDESIGKLSLSSGTSRGSWTIEPTDDGKAEFTGSRGSVSAEWIVDEMLTALI